MSENTLHPEVVLDSAKAVERLSDTSRLEKFGNALESGATLLDERFKALEKRIAASEAKIKLVPIAEDVWAKMSVVAEQAAEIETKVNGLMETDIKAIESTLKRDIELASLKVHARVAAIESRLDEHNRQVAQFGRPLGGI